MSPSPFKERGMEEKEGRQPLLNARLQWVSSPTEAEEDLSKEQPKLNEKPNHLYLP